ncbi:NUDIX domain-containing protein [Nocardioides cavernaquae]|uniref:NUDIX hydrolase n=1 Tax=Nocardioides cavernaquae TaxID=2321396 RepID=A0A3A5HEZ2_9ACTN|nr:NUDIX hydrolase [Nocardioides cavernaquae]RJS46560.1 NUDIX hydrolase [Nocardioides cavernaquae]
MTDGLPLSARPRVASGALFVNDVGHVLLVKPTYKDGWDIPGGYVEPGETPIEACEREIREELGLEVHVGNLLVSDWAPSEREGDKLLFVFAGGRLSVEELDAIELQREELEFWEFHAISRFSELMPDRLARRLIAAVDALASNTTAYLEHGLLRT